MPGRTSLVFFFFFGADLVSVAGGVDGVGSPLAAQTDTNSGAASTAIENIANVRSLIANLSMRLSQFRMGHLKPRSRMLNPATSASFPDPASFRTRRNS